MIKNFITILIGFLFFTIGIINKEFIIGIFENITHNNLISIILFYLIIGIPIFIATFLITKKLNFIDEYGFNKNILLGLVFAGLATIPMFIGGMIFFKLNTSLSFEYVIKMALIAGFFEELYFRGFLFAQLFKKTKLGFILSIFIGALIFSLFHLFGAQSFIEILGIFISTFIGAILFAWLYVEWNYNIWIPIFLHTFMNLAWVTFSLSENSSGNLYSNIFRILTILCAIVFTILWKRHKGEIFLINRTTIWLKK
ncbi:CPBP family intramembrane glutamic endopeptidase [Chryseobacterium sp.]|uniref:CPBP family intramembrane glutamic endopeptidase n=1 Tax=Chryseobacterium sp. TaxID=1871047 RepID=UPI0038906D75